MADEKLETAPRKGETADEFKSRILETQRDLARQKAQATAAPAPEATRAPAQVSAPAPVAQPQGEPPAPATRGVIPEVDEWWAKKGFKSPDDIANSYRELERELTRKNQELAKATQPAPAPVPMAPAIPNYWAQPQPPAWMPPVTPAPVQMPPQQTIEQLAEQYNLTPEDFKKVYAVANDLSQVTVQRELNRVMPGIIQQVRAVNGEVTRQREMVDLMSEPTWKNPQVQFEMHKVLNEDPAILQRQTLPYRYAHDEALKRIARANLGGSNVMPTTPTNPPASSGGRPPATAGSNGKGAEGAPAAAGTQEMTAEQYAALPLAEKRQFLQSLGAIGR